MCCIDYLVLMLLFWVKTFISAILCIVCVLQFIWWCWVLVYLKYSSFDQSVLTNFVINIIITATLCPGCVLSFIWRCWVQVCLKHCAYSEENILLNNILMKNLYYFNKLHMTIYFCVVAVSLMVITNLV